MSLKNWKSGCHLILEINGTLKHTSVFSFFSGKPVTNGDTYTLSWLADRGEIRTHNAGLWCRKQCVYWQCCEYYTIDPRALPWLPCRVFLHPKSVLCIFSSRVSAHPVLAALSFPCSAWGGNNRGSCQDTQLQLAYTQKTLLSKTTDMPSHTTIAHQ